MRGCGVAAIGGPVRLLELADPEPPGPGEVLLEVRAAGVGHWDELMRSGDWLSHLSLPYALGVEAAGVVLQVGAGVGVGLRGRRVLTHVYPLRENGTWAERLVVPVAAVAELDARLDWAVGAVLPVPLLTAGQALDALATDLTGARLLIHGGGGLTGGYLVELGLARGARVIVTAGQQSAERLSARGALVVDREDPDLVRAVREGLGAPPGLAVNARPGGAATAVVAVGDLAGVVSIAGEAPSGVRQVVVSADGTLLARLAALVADGTLAVPAVEVYRLEASAAALARAIAGAAGAGVAVTTGRSV